ncbi:RHS repeat-associated core domain-containing protein, partial [Lachnoanaerobaculum saburreum]|uniref:RHS repeat-associated core domain-containing protein n=1 Tax=Lachnoanaerobaculum saburreum TaxID=467210 RepID=UPI0012DFDC08
MFYTPFGDNEDTNFIDTQKALITSFGFDGEWKDSTGLYYLRARYYDPSDGVFLSEDSVSGDIESATG